MKRVFYVITGLVITATICWLVAAPHAVAQAPAVETDAAQHQRALDQYAESVKHSAELLRSQEEMHKRAVALFDTQEQLFKRQVADLDRYEKILDTWEKQQKQYQKYLDSLAK